MAQTYVVEGMSCGGCARSVAEAIAKAAPGVKVEVDHPSGRVSIEGSIDETVLRKAVEDAGFDYRGKAA